MSRLGAIAAACAALAGGGLVAGFAGADGAMKPAATQAELARAKQLLADFLGVAAEEMEADSVRIQQGGWQEERRLLFDEWRVPTADGGTERFSARVDLHGWYVASASWPDRDPGDEPPLGADWAGPLLMQAAATAFARHHFPRWSRDMRLEHFNYCRGSAPGTIYMLIWREKLQNWWTGSFARVSVTAWGAPEVVSYGARIAPVHSPDEVRVPRERALAIARCIAERVAGEPMSASRVEGWLSQVMVPSRGPTWVIYFETQRRVEGRAAGRLCLFIDAVTGADVTWALTSHGPPPDWPKPEDMPPELRPTSQESQAEADRQSR